MDNVHPIFQQALKPFMPDVKKPMDKAYELGLDHAITIAEQHRIPGQPLLNDQITDIVEKLKNLKS